jgi:hypothetical protein
LKSRTAEQHAVRYNDRRPPAGFQETQEERKEQKLGFFGLDHLEQILGRAFIVQRARERWIGENKVYFSVSPAWSWARLSR